MKSRSARSGLLLALTMLALILCACVTTESERLLRDFPALRPLTGEKSKINWTKYDGDDFLVFYGDMPPDPSAGAGIYQGGTPDFKVPRDAKPIKGKLGVFDVDWYALSGKDAKFYRTCLIDYQKSTIKRGQKTVQFTTKRHVWAYAETEEGLNAVLSELDKLTMFSARPAEITE